MAKIRNVSRGPTSFASEHEFRSWARKAILGRAKEIARLSAEDRQLAKAIEPYHAEIARRLRAEADGRDALVALFSQILTSN